MKRLITFLLLLVSLSMLAQEKRVIRFWHNNKPIEIAISDVDSIVFTKVQIENDNSEFVDLGLSVKWARCNLGATRPEEIGNKYAWGETVPKDSFSQETYKYWSSANQTWTKYNKSDNDTILQADDDAASIALEAPWRMPTKEECQELVDKCRWTRAKINGVSGCLVSNRQGKAIFLPETSNNSGEFWSASRSEYSDDIKRAQYLGFEFDDRGGLDNETSSMDRYYGLPIRAVRP